MDAQLEILSRALKPSPAQKLSVAKMTEKIREVLKRSLSSSPTAYTKAAIERLTKLTIQYDVDSGECEAITPQGSYNPVQNKLSICRSTMNLPVESAIAVITHELSHAVDPCTFDRIVTDQAKIRAITQGRREELTKCGLTKDKAELAGVMVSGVTKYESFDSSYANLLLKCGLAKIEALPPQAYSMEDSPFASLRRCIEAESIGQKRKDLIRRAYEREQSTLRQTGIELGPPQIPESKSGELRCGPANKEHFADALGSQLLADFLATQASTLDPKKLQHILYATSADGCSDSNDGEHPESDERLRLALQYPEVQRAVGCEKLTTAPQCADKSTGATSSAPAKSRSVQ